MIERKTFEEMYQGQAPWDIGKPQPVFVELEESGAIRGSVLDVGCGTGEHVLYLAARGHDCWGVDFVPVAVERAKAKAVHGVRLGIPVVEVADDGHGVGIRGPDREVGAPRPVQLVDVRAELLIRSVVRPVGEQIQVEVA